MECHLDPINRMEGPKKLSFELHNVDLSIVNAIRRIILTDIPNVAFYCEPYETNTSVRVIKNTGCLHNEFILHRLSMIPICFSKQEISAFREEAYLFKLNAANAGHGILDVTSGDIEVYKTATGLDEKVKLSKVERDRLFPKNVITGDYILLTKLRAKEELHLEGHAQLGTARTFAGFQPVSVCMHSYIKDPERVMKAKDALIASMKVPVDSPEGVKLIAKFDCLDADRHFYVNEYGDPCRFLFKIESECALSPNHLFNSAIRVLKHKLLELKSVIDNDEQREEGQISEKIQIEKFDAIPGCYQFVFVEEDDTVGNILQSFIMQKYIRNGELFQGYTVVYVGYCVPHPLDRKMVVRLVLESKDKAGDVPIVAYEKIVTQALYDVSESI